MEDVYEFLLLFDSIVEFGNVDLSYKQQKFYRKLNKEIMSLCDKLPKSTIKDARKFLKKYSNKSKAEEFDFFKRYPVPTWSIIYWLTQLDADTKKLKKDDLKNAVTAHSLAMMLHSLDDHLIDNQIPITHITLLLRTQAWVEMNAAFMKLADRVYEGDRIVKNFIDNYYSGICNPNKFESLDGYCDLFREQMATGFITPVLLAKRLSGDEDFANAIKTAFGSFGIAWKLLDDIQDIKKDMNNGIKTSVCICLPEDIRIYWYKSTRDKMDNQNDYAKIISNFILKNSIVDKVRKRIVIELESAASITDYYNMTGLANEFRSLLRTIKNA